MPIKIGEKLEDRYLILDQLGKGGMGKVFSAQDLMCDETHLVAIKELFINRTGDADGYNDDDGEMTILHQPALLSPDQQRMVSQQFFLEAKTLYNLNHANLPRVTDYSGQNDGNSYLVMDLVVGNNLEDKLDRLVDGGLPVNQVLGWMGQVFNALSYCHSKGVIHCDVKPANIIIAPQERAFLVDFGIAISQKFNRGVPTATTEGYSAPEQYIPDGMVDERTDIYAAGATLYHLLTGCVPVSSKERMKSTAALKPVRVLNPAVPIIIEKAIEKAMELDRECRFQNVNQFIEAISGQREEYIPVRKTGYATARTPSLVIFLMDTSISMDSYPCGETTRRDVAKEALKSVIQKMTARSIKSSIIAPRYRIALLAYGSGISDMLEGVKTITQLSQTGLPKEWPKEESTDTALGFRAAKKVLEKEIQNMKPDSPAPIIVHITDGEYTTEDPTPIVQEIMNMDTPGGKVLVENIFINDDFGPAGDIKKWKGITKISDIGNVYARNLYGISSVIPEEFRNTMREWGYDLDPQARLLFPGNQPRIVELGFITAAATPLQPK